MTTDEIAALVLEAIEELEAELERLREAYRILVTNGTT